MAGLCNDLMAVPRPQSLDDLRLTCIYCGNLGADYRHQLQQLSDYGRVPGILHYLIVHPTECYVILYKLGIESAETRVVREGELRLDPPGLVVPIAELFPPAVDRGRTA
jgi:hypothetical protein